MGYKEIWGFRQQISKTKYLKISQNIGGKYQEASREHHSTVQNCLRNSPGRRYQRLRIRLSREVETLSFSIRRQNSGREHPGGSARQLDAMAVAECKWRQPGATLCSDMWSGRPLMVYPDALSGYTPYMDSKELSSISDCFGDQKAIKTPKLNIL